MNKKTQFLLMSSLLFITVLILIIITIRNHAEEANIINYNSVVASEIIYQDYNFFHLLSKVLNAVFTKNYNSDSVDVTLSSVLTANYNPLTKLENLNSFLSLYKSKIGVNLTYSFDDLMLDISNNHMYTRILSPSNVEVSTNYGLNTITYTNIDEINYYAINMSFNGTVRNVSWSITPNGTQIPIIINGPLGFNANYTINKNGNYTLRINLNTTTLNNFVDFTFNYNTNTNVINYTSLNNIKLDYTVSIPSYGNVFKILSPYPNTRVNLGFGDYSVSRGFE